MLARRSALPLVYMPMNALQRLAVLFWFTSDVTSPFRYWGALRDIQKPGVFVKRLEGVFGNQDEAINELMESYKKKLKP